jgi:hypothetical protein
MVLGGDDGEECRKLYDAIVYKEAAAALLLWAI